MTALSAELLCLGGLAADDAAARAAIAEALASGAAADRFAAMVAALGGPGGIVDAPAAHLPAAPVQVAVAPAGQGFVRALDTRALGVAVMRLGGGRRRATDAIDHAVGLSDVASIGEAVGPERPLCQVHARRDEDARLAAAAVRAAISVGEAAAAAPPPVYERISAG